MPSLAFFYRNGVVFLIAYAVVATLVVAVTMEDRLLPRFMDVFLVGTTVAAFRFTWQHGLAMYIFSVLAAIYFLSPAMGGDGSEVFFRIFCYSAVSLIVFRVVHQLQHSRAAAIGALEELQVQSEAYRSLFEEAPVAFVEIDRNGRIRRLNKAGENLIGKSSAEAADSWVWEFIEEEARASCRETVLRKLEGRQASWPARLQIQRLGTAPHVELVDNPIVSPSGSIRGMRIAMLDFTERDYLQAQLTQAQRMESIGRLAGGIAHDFNNLLTVILGFGDQAMRKARENDPLRKILEQVLQAGERAATLTRQLLAFSRRQVLRPRILDINELVENMLPLTAPLLGERITLKTNFLPGIGKVSGEKAQLEQVLLNLVVNARDAMPGGGSILIETAETSLDQPQAHRHGIAEPGDYIVLSVTDSGLGMDQATLDHIFEPFFTTKAPGKGLGLGLSSCHGIVRQSGGYIWVYSEPGKGSIFKICLPCVEGEVTAEEPALPLASSAGTEVVLVVEDDPGVLEMVTSALSERGYRTLSAQTLRDAMEICRRRPEPIDLLLTDVILADGNGADLARQFIQIRPGVKILYMSGYTANVVVDRGLLKPGVQLVEKPFTPESLASQVRRILGANSVSQQVRVLVVDDDEQLRQIFRLVLEEEGYRVEEAANGKEALNCIEREAPDLVLMDLVMPEQEGLETIAQLRASNINVKIVAMSGAFQGRMLKIASLMGVDGTLEKPVDRHALLSLVQRFLRTQ